MNTRSVDIQTLWTVLAMEAALALPLISLPTQGDRLTGLAGPALLILLLPAGFGGVLLLPALREPSWRLLTGIGLALATRAVVSVVPEAGMPGIAMWLARSFVPAAIGIGLWWRGGALAVAELTPAEVRTEFSIIAICMLVILALIRPFLLPDPLLLGGCVGLFAVAGFIGTALARQDAAEIPSLRSGRALAVAAGMLAAAMTVLLVVVLRPELLAAMWLLVAHLIELLLTPLGLLLAWLASLFPRGAPAPLPAPPPLPTPAAPDPAALAGAQERLAWIGTVIAITLLACAGLAAILAARLLLSNFINAPQSLARARGQPDVVAESTGRRPTDDAADLLSWLMRLFRGRLARGSLTAPSSPRVDAWLAYRQMMTWAEVHGVGRLPAETTGQLSTRLARHFPEAAPAVELITLTYEWERYGAFKPTPERLDRVREAMATLEPG